MPPNHVPVFTQPVPPPQQNDSDCLSPYSSRSDEADDELSDSSSSRNSAMHPARGSEEANSHPPTYEGENTRPTSSKELLGFYAYSFAAEVFVVCGLGAFIPITLEDLARSSATAVLAHDHSKSCRASNLEPSVLQYALYTGKPDVNQCVFRMLGLEVNTASFAMYTFSFSVLLQAFVVVTMSGAADHGRYRKKLLLGFSVVGAVATMLFLFVTPGTYLFGSLLAIIGNVCVGASFVLLNSFLPLLVRHHPETTQSVDESEGVVEDDAAEVSMSICLYHWPSMVQRLSSRVVCHLLSVSVECS
jgi:UMF1 family MFS transporter